MTPQQAQEILEFELHIGRMELQTTRRVLAAVPDEQAAYTPHEKSMTAGQLAAHIAGAEEYFLNAVLAGEFAPPDKDAPNPWANLKPSEIAARYAEKIPQLLDEVGRMSGERLVKPVQFHTFTMPAVRYLGFSMAHTIHHRGQLSVYLRPMGAKVPSIYGSSADESMAEAAAQS